MGVCNKYSNVYSKNYLETIYKVRSTTRADFYILRRFRECALIIADIPIDGFAHLVTLVRYKECNWVQGV